MNEEPKPRREASADQILDDLNRLANWPIEPPLLTTAKVIGSSGDPNWAENDSTHHYWAIKPDQGLLVGEGRAIEPPAPPVAKSTIKTYDPDKVVVTFTDATGKVHVLEGIDATSVSDIEVAPHSPDRRLSDVKFTMRLQGAVYSHVVTFTVPNSWGRKWRRRKRMALRRRRGRGACSS